MIMFKRQEGEGPPGPPGPNGHNHRNPARPNPRDWMAGTLLSQLVQGSILSCLDPRDVLNYLRFFRGIEVVPGTEQTNPIIIGFDDEHLVSNLLANAGQLCERLVEALDKAREGKLDAVLSSVAGDEHYDGDDDEDDEDDDDDEDQDEDADDDDLD